ncbi:MAG: hypothetical protein IH600_08235 [Bacteroidetes bacterium]|nr:hypothetical protein [Bacteroidota bacterium]
MHNLITFSMILIAAVTCSAQESSIVVGEYSNNGTIELIVSQGAVYAACQKVKNTSTGERVQMVNMDAHITAGQTPYLVCEINGVIFAFECYQEGRNILIKPDGTTHLGESDLCYNCAFLWDETGAIVGCGCEDKLYEGPKRTCNHSIFTPQRDIISAIGSYDQQRPRMDD